MLHAAAHVIQEVGEAAEHAAHTVGEVARLAGQAIETTGQGLTTGIADLTQTLARSSRSSLYRTARPSMPSLESEPSELTAGSGLGVGSTNIRDLGGGGLGGGGLGGGGLGGGNHGDVSQASAISLQQVDLAVECGEAPNGGSMDSLSSMSSGIPSPVPRESQVAAARAEAKAEMDAAAEAEAEAEVEAEAEAEAARRQSSERGAAIVPISSLADSAATHPATTSSATATSAQRQPPVAPGLSTSRVDTAPAPGTPPAPVAAASHHPAPFLGVHVLTARRAPEPSDIRWIDLESNRNERKWRK